MNLHIILYIDTITGFKYFIKYNILGFYKNTENVKGLNDGNKQNQIFYPIQNI
jgi:hypothetical protein